ncbi:MAG: aldo/keto reductase [Saccharospirillum sp.]
MTSPKQRTLGKTGYRVSEIGLGCWQLGGDWGALEAGQAESVLAAATSADVNFWDTADVYGGGASETVIGQFQKAHPDAERIIVTKAGRGADLYPDHYTKTGLQKAIDASRRRLQVDQLDLVQLHCIPIEVIKQAEVFDWLESFQQQGLIRHYGASVETIDDALHCINNTGVASLQLICNLLRQDMAETVLPRAKDANVGVIIRLGLASGLLSGKLKKDQVFAKEDHRSYNQNGDAFFVGETFAGLPYNTGVELAERLTALCPPEMSLAQLSLRWLLDQPGVSSVITGASRPEQIAANAAVSQMPPLPADLHKALAEFYRTEVRQHIRGAI